MAIGGCSGAARYSVGLAHSAHCSRRIARWAKVQVLSGWTNGNRGSVEVVSE